MKFRNALFVVIAFSLIACESEGGGQYTLESGLPDDSGRSTGPDAPVSDAGVTESIAEQAVDDGAGQGLAATGAADGSSGVPDSTPEASAEVSPDPGSGAADGLLGSPCVVNTDCMENPEHTCFFGFCTERCSQDGVDLPGTCQNVSDASIFGDEWGCPADLVYCMPGLVQDKSIICSKDADCVSIQSGMTCGAAVLISSKIVDGVCVPDADRASSGDTCSDNQDCKSLMCMGEDPENGVDGYCTSHCETNTQCASGHLCTGIGFITEDETDETSAWGGYCLDIGIDAETGDELIYCTSQAKCPDGFYCNAFIEPSSLGAQTWCIPVGEGTAAVGDACASAEDCTGGSCYWGEDIQTGTEGYCSWDCPGGPDDCGEGQACVQRALHNNGTLDDPTDDHKTIGTCVFNGLGDPCVLGEDWCANGLQCVHPDGWQDSFGQCL